MHDETCRELARVLGERNDGFVQMLLVSGDNARDQAFYEEVATLERPAGHHERRAGLRSQAAHPSPRARLAEELPRARHPRGRPGAHDRRGLHLHLRGVEPVRRFPGVVRGHDGNARRTPGQAGRSGAPRGACATSCRSPRPGHCRRSPSSARSSRRTRSGSTTRWPMPARRWASIRSTSCSTWRSRRISRPSSSPHRPNGKIEHLKELVDDPYVLFGVSDGGAHTKFLTAGRYPTETLCKVVREHKMLSLEDVHWRLSRPAGRGRGLPRPRRAEEGRAGRHRGLRLRRAEGAARRDRPRPAGRRMAAHPARPGLQVRAGERRGHDPQRPARPTPIPAACCGTAHARSPHELRCSDALGTKEEAGPQGPPFLWAWRPPYGAGQG